jgi:iron complex transport system permease protein
MPNTTETVRDKSAPTEYGRIRPYSLLWTGLVAVLVAVVCASLVLGAPIPFGDLWSGDAAKQSVAREIFWHLRPLRIAAGLLVGASLAVSGAALQSTFRNPLAEPYLLGISAGGALGAALGLAFAASPAVPVLAFGGALAAAFVVYAMGAAHAGFDRARLLLVGVALSAFLSAALSLLVTLSNRAELAQQILFWTLGGLADVGPAQLWTLAVSLGAGIALLGWSARDLNALRLGDDDARSLGVEVKVLHRRLLVAAALMSAAAVASAGLIGFVGLLAPHMVRKIFGDDARVLVPAAAIGGAALLCGCDAIARSALRPVEIPVGIVTALLGVPLFLGLARRV